MCGVFTFEACAALILSCGPRLVLTQRRLVGFIPGAKNGNLCDAGQLRPIALCSHVYKTYSRIIMQRVSAQFFPPIGPEQTACRGRQAGDTTWALQNIAQLSLEWGIGLSKAKLDISRAFDSVNRRTVAKRLIEKFGDSRPAEVTSLLMMLESEVHLIPTEWGQCEYSVGTGVKQGALESPWLFALVVPPGNPRNRVGQ